MQGLKGEPPDSQVEEFIQCIIPFKDSPVERIIQGRQDRQDLKGKAPDSQVEEIIQSSTLSRDAQWRFSYPTVLRPKLTLTDTH